MGNKFSGILNKWFDETDCVDIDKIQCVKCNKNFKTNSDLKGHVLRKHTDNSEILWKICNSCNYKCKTNSVLTEHIFHKHTKRKN